MNNWIYYEVMHHNDRSFDVLNGCLSQGVILRHKILAKMFHKSELLILNRFEGQMKANGLIIHS